MTKHKLSGLIAATHTPFGTDGALNLAIVEKQAAHSQRAGITTVFIAGSTGESHSLNVDERRQLAERWMDVTRGTPMKVIVHVGSNCLVDAKTLAAHAEKIGSLAVAALAPSYFKPPTLDILIQWCAEIAGAAPGLPFYYYDIPALTGVSFPMPQFLERAMKRIPNFAGLKFTNPDLDQYGDCLGRGVDVAWGLDESLLSALEVGAQAAVGSSYNFAAPLYQHLWKSFQAGDLHAARTDQVRSVQMIETIAATGYLGTAKAVMKMLGVDVGPARLPNANPNEAQLTQLRQNLEKLGFFDWIKA